MLPCLTLATKCSFWCPLLWQANSSWLFTWIIYGFQFQKCVNQNFTKLCDKIIMLFVAFRVKQTVWFLIPLPHRRSFNPIKFTNLLIKSNERANQTTNQCGNSRSENQISICKISRNLNNLHSHMDAVSHTSFIKIIFIILPETTHEHEPKPIRFPLSLSTISLIRLFLFPIFFLIRCLIVEEENNVVGDSFWADFVKGETKLNYNIRLK